MILSYNPKIEIRYNIQSQGLKIVTNSKTLNLTSINRTLNLSKFVKMTKAQPIEDTAAYVR